MSDLLNFDVEEEQSPVPMDKSFDDIFSNIDEVESTTSTLDDILTPEDKAFQPSSPKKVIRKKSLKKTPPKVNPVNKATMDDLFGDLETGADPFSSAKVQGFDPNYKDSFEAELFSGLTPDTSSSTKMPVSSAANDLDDFFGFVSGNPAESKANKVESLGTNVDTLSDLDDLLGTAVPTKASAIDKRVKSVGIFGAAFSQSSASNKSLDVDTLVDTSSSESGQPYVCQSGNSFNVDLLAQPVCSDSVDVDSLFTPTVDLSGKNDKSGQSQAEALKMTTDAPEQSVGDSQRQGQVRLKHQNSLDILLDSQPLGTVPSCDDLCSVTDPESSNSSASTNSQFEHVEIKQSDPDDSFGETKARQGEEREPQGVESGDTLDSYSDHGKNDGEDVNESEPITVSEGVSRKHSTGDSDRDGQHDHKPLTNLKKGKMERSFEDLLTGLSDESEPELDDMIIHGVDSSNLESILMSPGKAERPRQEENTLGSPAYDMDDPFSMDVTTSTPNVPRTDNRAPQLHLETPEHEQRDLFGSLDGNNAANSSENEDVDMRNKEDNPKAMASSASIDLDNVEDTNHLDVDVNKHKSALGKQGSMALRRKPSRKSRKSLLSTGEDSIFQDSTEPRPSMVNGEGDGDEDDEDLSPPHKKPSPALLVPLPGMSTSRHSTSSPRLSSSSNDDADNAMETKEAKRVSRPPPGALILPAMAAGGAGLKSRKKSSTDSQSSHVKSDTPSTYEKPVLKKVNRSSEEKRARSPESSDTGTFTSPALRSVGNADVGKSRDRSESAERDVTFQPPALRSTRKHDVKKEEKMDTNSGVFTKPALKSTPKPKVERHSSREMESEETMNFRNLRSTPVKQPSIESTTEIHSNKHTFDKPKLKQTGRKLSSSDSIDSDRSGSSSVNETTSTKRFEKPPLRTTNKDVRSDSSNISNEGSEHSTHTFEKPALKSTGGNVHSIGAKTEQFTQGTFEKPQLKKASVPAAVKEEEDVGTESSKGMFSRPALRRTETSSRTPDRERAPEKPAWLQTAANKQSKVRDVLQTKENHNSSTVPSWLDKPALKKTSRPQPLQETSNNIDSHADENEDDIPPATCRSRKQSETIDTEPQKASSDACVPKEQHNNYTPSWMRQGRSPSLPPTSAVLPALSVPALNNESSDSVPQWQRELAQRRLNKKANEDTSTSSKKDENAEPEWKKGFALRKTRHTAAQSRANRNNNEMAQSTEPEWKKAAEEKRARLRSKSLQYSHLKLT